MCTFTAMFYFNLQVLDTFLSLKIKETNLNNPDLEKRKQLEEKKSKMRKLSRSQRRVSQEPTVTHALIFPYSCTAHILFAKFSYQQKKKSINQKKKK